MLRYSLEVWNSVAFLVNSYFPANSTETVGGCYIEPSSPDKLLTSSAHSVNCPGWTTGSWVLVSFRAVLRSKVGRVSMYTLKRVGPSSNSCHTLFPIVPEVQDFSPCVAILIGCTVLHTTNAHLTARQSDSSTCRALIKITFTSVFFWLGPVLSPSLLLSC